MRTLTQFTGRKKPRQGAEISSLSLLQEQELLRLCQNVAKQVCGRNFPHEVEDAASMAMIRALKAVHNGCTPQTINWVAHKGALEHYKTLIRRESDPTNLIHPISLDDESEYLVPGVPEERYSQVVERDWYEDITSTLREKEAIILDAVIRQGKTLIEAGKMLPSPVSPTRAFHLYNSAIKRLREKEGLTQKPAKTESTAKGQRLVRCTVCRMLHPKASFKSGRKQLYSDCRVCRSYTNYTKYDDPRVNRTRFLRTCWDAARLFRLLQEDPPPKGRRPLALPRILTGQKGVVKGMDRYKHVILSRLHPVRYDPNIRLFLKTLHSDVGQSSMPAEVIDFILDEWPTSQQLADRYGLSVQRAKNWKRRLTVIGLGVRRPKLTLKNLLSKRQKASSASDYE